MALGHHEPPTLGVEEEYFLVDTATRLVSPSSTRVLRRARALLGPQVSGEFTEYQIEAKTRPCTWRGELVTQISRMRAAVAHAARAEGLGVVASGTPLLGAQLPAPRRADPRYDEEAHAFRSTIDDYVICSLHTHVQLPDRDEAVLVGNHLRPWLPLLVSLSANSPYWAEKDTGYASWRTVIKSRGPADGPPPYFPSPRDFDTTLSTLSTIGVLNTPRDLLWDIRPGIQLPTVEIRVMDVPVTATESTALACLVRALVIQSAAMVRRGDPGPPVPQQTLRAAYWRAARDGYAGRSWDPLTGQLLATPAVARKLLHHIGPVLEEHRELTAVLAFLHDLETAGDGSSRQRAAFASRDSLVDVVDYLVGDTHG
ncbi:carboxylate-amine ligase [Streptoalloteichus hindustanus]|uniref:Putative glutamate--cysteine ligase 2 n=1 Tax=Streptoalloteichus hindustanus TaxID=2017 RepID=A0A1M5IGZ1_STRHI|nr:glutamate--cysteine ligase [Streptoalloteichus hindustanus]SHG27562.1 carboxylate-amine ligase [Streptoalloteichus hindustanus]